MVWLGPTVVLSLADSPAGVRSREAALHLSAAKCELLHSASTVENLGTRAQGPRLRPCPRTWLGLASTQSDEQTIRRSTLNWSDLSSRNCRCRLVTSLINATTQERTIVEAIRNPVYLRRLAAAVADFQNALSSFLELHVENHFVARGMAPAVFPRDDADEAEVRRRADVVSEAAGRARAAPALTNVRFNVQGAGSVDPISAWATISQPKPLLEPTNILDACAQIKGALEDLIARADAEAPPEISAGAMHPLIWGAAAHLWGDKHYRQAVTAGAEALIAQVKARTGRYDASDTALWTEAFSDKPPAPNKPRLRWPGDPVTDKAVKNMNHGLRLFAPGVQMLVRNEAPHSTEAWTEQEALERLATLSLLAGWVAACALEELT